MLSTAVASASSICHNSEFDSWKFVGVRASSVIMDLKRSFLEEMLLRRKSSKETRERWFGVDTVVSSVVSEPVPRTTVRNSNVEKTGEGGYVEESHEPCLKGCSCTFLSPGKKEAGFGQSRYVEENVLTS